MIAVRKSEDRGHANHGWLDTYHTFSFNTYYDPAHMQFQTLRVLNDDVIGPGMGFGTHGHKEMEILTWVIEGALQHKDSTGGGGVISAGEIQSMSAGTGIRHSEFNASKTDRARLLQMWVLPGESGLAPGYEQKAFPIEERINRLRLVAARDARDGAVKIHQDVDLYVANLESGAMVQHAIARGRSAWLQVATGELTLNGTALKQGDGAAVTDESALEIRSQSKAEILLFDLG